MLYRSYAIIKNDNGIEIDEPFTDIIDRKGYLIIDKEEYARRIIENEDVSELDESDIMIIVDDYLTEFSEEITNLIMEIRCE